MVEIPGSALWEGETAVEINVGGHALGVVSLEDLVLDRLTQATDGTQVTWDDALSLSVATWDRVDWDKVRSRCMSKRSEDLGLQKSARSSGQRARRGWFWWRLAGIDPTHLNQRNLAH